MPLSSGSKLGPYEILDPLGAGGMGEVYRAHDARLGRDVAIKVLPDSLSRNPEVRARFEREAKTISSLNHPHICVLHDVGREGDVDFLVMELVEGGTLAERLVKGPLPPNEALKIGSQIADALDRAHRAGVIHRDLKPGNVMLTRSGAKLMDFGLARVAGPSAADGSGVTVAGLTESPTVAQPLTAEGAILGTFQYMAPEQLEGQDTDERADLWALGCVLYEMTTGQRAFEAKSQASLIGAIMHKEPAPVSQIVPVSPPQLDRLISACLVKDPTDRVQSAHDIKLQLEWIADGATSASAAAAPPLPKARRRPSWIALATVVVAAVAVTAAVMTLISRGGNGSSSPQTPQRYILAPANLQVASTPAVSPDGAYVVVSVSEGISPRLYRRAFSSWELTPIAGTEDGRAPFFSPDGAWIAFCTEDAIKKVPSGGGVAQLITNYPRPDAGDWGRDGMIYFTPRNGGEDGVTGLARVPVTGGKAETVSVLEDGENDAWLPEILPDGKTVLYSVLGGRESAWRIVAARPDGTRSTVIENAFLGRYSTTGYLLYWDGESTAVLAAPFDPDVAMITGPAVPLTEEVDGAYCFGIGTDGQLVYVPSPTAGEGAEIIWLDRDGSAQPVADMRSAWTQPRVSPDGKRILLRKTGTFCELWMLDVERASIGRVVQGDDNHDAIWSPDGGSIAFERVSASVVVTLSVNGPRTIQTIAEGSDRGSPQSWSAGGNLFAYTLTGRGSRTDIWVRTMDGVSAPEAFIDTEFDETSPAISSDGRWIAYVSNETGNREVFIRPYPDTGRAWQVSTEGGNSPVWARDGSELFFASGTEMMAVPTETEPTLVVGTPVALFDGGFSTARARDFDVAPDGRFVTVRRPDDGRGRQELRVLLNWPQVMTQLRGPAN